MTDLDKNSVNVDINIDDKLNSLKKDKNNLDSISNTNTSADSLNLNATKEDIKSTGSESNNSHNTQIKENRLEKFFNFTFYKVDPKWRWLNEIGKDESSIEFLDLLKAANTKMIVKTYSTIGLRHDSEFMIWTISSSL